MFKYLLYLIVVPIILIGENMKAFLLLVLLLGAIAWNYYDNPPLPSSTQSVTAKQPEPTMVEKLSKWLVDNSNQKQ